MMASVLGQDEAIHNIVCIGVPDTKALMEVQKRLARYQIPHYSWVEPDFDFGFTSICTTPIEGKQRRVMKKYRLYNDSPLTEQSANFVTEERGANTRIAQRQSTCL